VPNRLNHISFQISFKTGVVARSIARLSSKFAGASKRSLFFGALVTDDGIVISRPLKIPVHIPWSEVQCLDLSGLKRPDLRWMEEVGWFARLWPGTPGSTRFFLLTSDNYRLLQSCCCGKNTWLAGINVLGITGIKPGSAEALLPLVRDIADKKKIKLDIICLDY
jgi:hypothetical protein